MERKNRKGLEVDAEELEVLAALAASTDTSKSIYSTRELNINAVRESLNETEALQEILEPKPKRRPKRRPSSFSDSWARSAKEKAPSSVSENTLDAIETIRQDIVEPEQVISKRVPKRRLFSLHEEELLAESKMPLETDFGEVEFKADANGNYFDTSYRRQTDDKKTTPTTQSGKPAQNKKKLKSKRTKQIEEQRALERVTEQLDQGELHSYMHKTSRVNRFIVSLIIFLIVVALAVFIIFVIITLRNASPSSPLGGV